MELTCPFLEIKTESLFLWHWNLWDLTPNIWTSSFSYIISKMVRCFIPQLYSICGDLNHDWRGKKKKKRTHPEKKLISTYISSAKISDVTLLNLSLHEGISRLLVSLLMYFGRVDLKLPSLGKKPMGYSSLPLAGQMRQPCTHCGLGGVSVFTPHCTPMEEWTGFASSYDFSCDRPVGAKAWVRAVLQESQERLKM